MMHKVSPLKAPPVAPTSGRTAMTGRRSSRVLAAAAVVFVTAGLAACAAVSDLAGETGLPVQDWSDVREQREPKPELVEFSHDVRFAGNRYGLDADAVERLQTFLARTDIGYGDTVVVTAAVPQGATGGNAAWLAGRRADAVKAYLARARINASVIQTATDAVDAGERVTVYVRRYVAVLPPCPDWTGVPGVNFNNQPASNWSCATAVNFGMMLANPGDLVRGRDPGYADGEVGARSVENYRKGKTKPIIRDASAAEIFPDAGGESDKGE
jgi:pilus biogenesis lipoprotein CpaD